MLVGTCESEIFVRITNRISGYDSNSNLESNQGVVVYVFNADCHRNCVKNEVVIIIIVLANVYALAT